MAHGPDPQFDASPWPNAGLAWLQERQRVLAQNIANADTPGYRPRDLGSFQRSLAGACALPRTAQRHLPGPPGRCRARVDRSAPTARRTATPSRSTAKRMKVADTDTAHALATGLHRRWVGLFRTALGRPQ